jgi:exodeoxyribonuclease V alpha subunit
VLLGDPDQLASVEVGSVLADPSLDAHVALDHTWRYAPESGIARLASAIRAGDPEVAVAALAGAGWVSDPPADDRTRRALIAAPLRGGYTELSAAAEPTAALAALGRFRLLCGHWRGPFGMEEVHVVARAVFQTGSRPFLVTANDARLGVFNGDAGVVLPDAAGVPTLCLPGPRS